jgi:hypothetical protein
MRLGREWLAAAAIVAVLVSAGTDLVLIVADRGSQARAAANQPWPTPEATRTVSITSPTPRPPAMPRTPTTPKLAADSVAIPAQHVRAPIVDYCQIIAGGLEPPSDVHQVCYWAGGASIDEHVGTTVLTGHINWVGQGTGAFGNLAALHRGETVYTSDAHGKVTAWRIARVQHRSKTLGVDPAAFVGHTGPRQLYLISCGGAFDAAELSYVDNIYVLAKPAPTVPPAPPAAAPPPLPKLR